MRVPHTPKHRAGQFAHLLQHRRLEERIDRAQAGPGDEPGLFVVKPGAGDMFHLAAGLFQLIGQGAHQPPGFAVQRRRAKIIRPGNAQVGQVGLAVLLLR